MYLPCPKCRIVKMTEESFYGTLIDRCPACKGLFFNPGELEMLLRQSAGNAIDTLVFSPTSDEMDLVPAECPSCRQPMARVKGPGEIRVERCRQCGSLFFDQGEFASLQLYFP